MKHILVLLILLSFQFSMANDFVSCEAYRDHMYGQGDMHITIAHGYSDTIDEGGNYVADKITGESLAFKLTRTCDKDNYPICGFTLLSPLGAVPFLLQKAFEYKGQPFNINLTIVNSAYTYVHTDNLTTYKNEQAAKSAQALQLFNLGLMQSQVVFYEGHSRDGGGPDFNPPRARASGGVDYDWYHRNRPGLKNMLNVLGSTATPPKMLGFFSCDSQDHFKSYLTKAVPNSYLIFSKYVDMAKVVKAALMLSIKGILTYQCPEDMASTLDANRFILYSPK